MAMAASTIITDIETIVSMSEKPPLPRSRVRFILARGRATSMPVAIVTMSPGPLDQDGTVLRNSLVIDSTRSCAGADGA